LLYTPAKPHFRESQCNIPKEKQIMTNLFKRLIREDDGMEMIEWAIVGVVFAVAAAAFWGTLSGAVDGALQDIAAEVDPGSAP
jgi:Flp pilus assembly pilin Flp